MESSNKVNGVVSSFVSAEIIAFCEFASHRFRRILYFGRMRGKACEGLAEEMFCMERQLPKVVVCTVCFGPWIVNSTNGTDMSEVVGKVSSKPSRARVKGALASSWGGVSRKRVAKRKEDTSEQKKYIKSGSRNSTIWVRYGWISVSRSSRPRRFEVNIRKRCSKDRKSAGKVVREKQRWQSVWCLPSQIGYVLDLLPFWKFQNFGCPELVPTRS